MADLPSLNPDFEMLDGVLAGDERIELSHAGGELQDVEEELDTIVSGIPRCAYRNIVVCIFHDLGQTKTF